MSSVSERAIDGEFAGAWLQDVEDFPDHDGEVRTSGGLSGGEDLGDGVRVLLGIEFLVFVLEVARVFTRISGTAAMRRWRGFVHRLSRRRHRGREVVPLLVGLFEFLGEVGEFAVEGKRGGVVGRGFEDGGEFALAGFEGDDALFEFAVA